MGLPPLPLTLLSVPNTTTMHFRQVIGVTFLSYIRGLAINLIYWVNSHYVLMDIKEHWKNFIKLASSYLHQQVKGILKYKKLAKKHKITGNPNCTSEDLCHQIELSLQLWKNRHTHMEA